MTKSAHSHGTSAMSIFASSANRVNRRPVRAIIDGAKHQKNNLVGKSAPGWGFHHIEVPQYYFTHTHTHTSKPIWAIGFDF